MYRLLSARIIFRGSIKPSLRQFSTNPERKDIGKVALGIGLGTLATIAGTVLYANNNPNFRKTLKDNIPILVNIFETEEKEVENVKFLNVMTKIEEQKESIQESDQVVGGLITEDEPEFKEDSTENVETPDLETWTEAINKGLLELQSELRISCLDTLSAYSIAAQAVRGLTEELDQYVQEVNNNNPHQPASSDSIILHLLEKDRDCKELVRVAESAAKLARSHVDELRKTLSDLCCSDFPLSEEMVILVENSLAEAETQLGEAEEFLKHALAKSSPPEILRKRVSQVTADLEEELGFSLLGSDSSEERDVFLWALAWQLLQYRKEVMQTKEQLAKHTKELLSSSGPDGMEMRLEALIQAKQAELKNSLSEENYLQLSQLRKKLDHQLREDLRIQQWHLDEARQAALRDKRAAFDRELAEQWSLAMSLINDNKQELIEELNKALHNVKRIEHDVQQSSAALVLSTASHTMLDSLKIDPFPQLNWSHQIQPIDNLLYTIRSVSCEGADEFLNITIECIPKKAITRGVYTLNALKKRFYEVEQLARKVSLLKKRENNTLFMYFMSYLRSVLLIRPVSAISSSEKENEPKCLRELQNEDILDRAKFFIEQGDYGQAVRYMNLLQGVAQFVTSGWTEEMLLHLEVMQAAQALSSFSALLVHHHIKD